MDCLRRFLFPFPLSLHLHITHAPLIYMNNMETMSTHASLIYMNNMETTSCNKSMGIAQTKYPNWLTVFHLYQILIVVCKNTVYLCNHIFCYVF